MTALRRTKLGPAVGGHVEQRHMSSSIFFWGP